MSLLTSISGIRGTIGGKAGENLTPVDVVQFASAYAQWLKKNSTGKLVIIGRDARPSGQPIASIVCSTLQLQGISVIDCGLVSTPTVELMVKEKIAAGGIIVSASHNPQQWNALKLLNSDGEFLNEQETHEILELVASNNFLFNEWNKLGEYKKNKDAGDVHIEKILALPIVNKAAITKKKYRIVVDGVNSVGGISIPKLLNELGAGEVIEVNCTPTGKFAHNPEPLPENLTELQQQVKLYHADLGIAVDPDVDRLAFVCDDGSFFGEEYTLVAVADYVLKNQKGNTVSNLSSSRALKDITEKAGGKYFATAVGEAHVVYKMKEVNAVIGGEGNGGVIYPALHYGRDALVGVALFLSHLATSGKTCAVLRATYPNYIITKNKIQLTSEVNIDAVIHGIQTKYRSQPINTEDGLKIEFDEDWVHLRRSNTEPIIRIYAESRNQTTADSLATKLINDIKDLMRGNYPLTA